MRRIAVVISNNNENVTPIETIDAIKYAGFKDVFIQWYNKDWEYSQYKQLEYAKEQGLNVIFAHLGYKNINDLWKNDDSGDKLIENYKEDIKMCYQNGIPMVIMHLTSKEEAPGPNEIGLNRIRKIVDYAKKLGIKIAFENTKIKGYLEYVIRNINDDNVGICYDAGHCHVHFNDEFNYELFKNKILAVHLHDNDKTDDLHLLPFDGTIEWEKVMKKLKEEKYEGPITLETVYRYDYKKITVKEFYKRAYEIGEKLNKMIE